MPLNRLQDWEKFNLQMYQHIQKYTIPQYQNEDDKTDQVGIWSAEDCIAAIRKYVSRFGKNQRGAKEQMRDMLKIAHYAQFAYDKLKDVFNEEDIY